MASPPDPNPPHLPIGDTTDPALAYRWLGVARRGTLLAQVLIMIAAEAGTQLHIHSPVLLAVVGAWATWDLLQRVWLRRHPAPGRAIIASAGLDLAALTAILALSGGPHHPLLFGYLAWLALLAMVLPARQAWVATGVAILLEALVVWHPATHAGAAADGSSTGHLLSHMATFDVSAASITWIVTRLSQALRSRSAAELEAQRRLAVAERLAALGTLAAGVAHELGTPLGTIQLLAEQVRARRPEPDTAAPLGTLLEQVARCREILDRLRGRDSVSAADCALDLARWVTEWRRAEPEVQVDLIGTLEGERVAGSAESWRGAVWVALDNARRAGARRVTVKSARAGSAIELRIEDDGRGLSAEAARHAGEPFWTGWGGTGLGLFVTRSFAQSVGGDVLIEPAEGAGARTRILLPRVNP